MARASMPLFFEVGGPGVPVPPHLRR